MNLRCGSVTVIQDLDARFDTKYLTIQLKGFALNNFLTSIDTVLLIWLFDRRNYIVLISRYYGLLLVTYFVYYSIRDVTAEVGAAVLRAAIEEDLAEGHGDVGVRELAHMSKVCKSLDYT